MDASSTAATPPARSPKLINMIFRIGSSRGLSTPEAWCEETVRREQGGKRRHRAEKRSNVCALRVGRSHQGRQATPAGVSAIKQLPSSQPSQAQSDRSVYSSTLQKSAPCMRFRFDRPRVASRRRHSKPVTSDARVLSCGETETDCRCFAVRVRQISKQIVSMVRPTPTHKRAQ